MAKEVVLRYFGVDQFLVRLAPRAGIERSFRGNRLVPLSAVRRETVISTSAADQRLDDSQRRRERTHDLQILAEPKESV